MSALAAMPLGVQPKPTSPIRTDYSAATLNPFIINQNYSGVSTLTGPTGRLTIATIAGDWLIMGDFDGGYQPTDSQGNKWTFVTGSYSGGIGITQANQTGLDVLNLSYAASGPYTATAAWVVEVQNAVPISAGTMTVALASVEIYHDLSSTPKASVVLILSRTLGASICGTATAATWRFDCAIGSRINAGYSRNITAGATANISVNSSATYGSGWYIQIPAEVPYQDTAATASVQSNSACIVIWSMLSPLVAITNSTVVWGTTFGAPIHSASVGSATATDYSITGLVANTTYFIQVETWSAYGPGLFSIATACHTLSNTPPVVIPSVLVASGASTSSVVAAWTAPRNVTVSSYTLYYGTTFGVWANSVGESTAVHATLTGLATNTTYFLQVDAQSNVTQSNIAVAHTLSNTPFVVIPPVLSASGASGTTIVSAWSAPRNVTVSGYTLYYGTTFGVWANSVGESTAVHATLTGLATNTTYFLQVDAQSNVTQSNIAVAHTLSNTLFVVIPPVLSASGASGTTIVSAWTAPRNVTVSSYTLYYGTTFGVWANSVGESTAVHATLTGLAVNTTYFLQVDAQSNVTQSNIAVAHTLSNTPFVVIPPVLSASGASGTTIVSAWSAPRNVTVSGYTLYYGTTFGVWANSVGESTAVHTTLTGLATNTTYFLQVDAQSNVTQSNIAVAHTLSNTPPVVTIPFLSAAAISVNEVTLTWTAPQNVSVSSYEIEWGTSYGSYGSGVNEATALDASVSGLAENTTYWFVVNVNDASAIFSNVAPAHTFSTVAPYPSTIFPPVLAGVGVSTSQANLTWTAPQNVSVSSYWLEYGTAYGVYLYSLNVGTALEADVTGLAANTTYYFVVNVNDASTVYSNVAPIHTLAVVTPYPKIVLPPALAAAADSTNSVELAWTAPVNVTVTNYTILIGTTYGAWITQISAGLAFNYTARGLDENSTYYFEVETWNGALIGVLSNVAPVHTFAIVTPPPPTPLVVMAPILSVVENGTGSIEVVWTMPQNATATNYTLLVGAPYGTWAFALSEGTALNATVESLTANSLYYVQVEVWNGTTQTLQSNVAIAHTLPYPYSPPAPTPFPWTEVFGASAFISILLIALAAGIVNRSHRTNDDEEE